LGWAKPRPSKPGGIVELIDGSDFAKKGEDSAGVARQYCGELGKVENCQAGVFLGYVSSKGYTLLDRSLYLPEDWFSTEYEERRRKCGIPEELIFKSKAELALEMVSEQARLGVLPYRWLCLAHSRLKCNDPDVQGRLPQEECGSQATCAVAG
jgi:SRSO17 transposase